ncbi:hypothetical protein QF117_03920 [Vibrio sp. YMD68]|uniref:hypothetical protein n=1 Tax=Vibrio sp. YMD68 TaxID=3042300 RepID=UPI00249C03D2|nr:hypothetical protein [Vibrio sp. YMD68]WGV98014.1 hypothetical protein QF117_03920 [Vibrio sp. YMD68]
MKLNEIIDFLPKLTESELKEIEVIINKELTNREGDINASLSDIEISFLLNLFKYEEKTTCK